MVWCGVVCALCCNVLRCALLSCRVFVVVCDCVGIWCWCCVVLLCVLLCGVLCCVELCWCWCVGVCNGVGVCVVLWFEVLCDVVWRCLICFGGVVSLCGVLLCGVVR